MSSLFAVVLSVLLAVATPAFATGLVDSHDMNQGQAQGQAQGQLQGQAQGQTQKAIGVGVGIGVGVAGSDASAANSFEQTYIEKRELLQVPTGPVAPVENFKGPYKKGVAGTAKPWELIKSWNRANIEAFYSAFDNASCSVYKTTTKEIAPSEKLDIGKVNKPVIAIIQCNADDDNALFGTLGTKALAVGATNVEEVAYAVTFASEAKGWTIGLGGGASVIGRDVDDNKGGTIGGGTGISSITAYSVEKIKAIFLAR